MGICTRCSPDTRTSSACSAARAERRWTVLLYLQEEELVSQQGCADMLPLCSTVVQLFVTLIQEVDGFHAGVLLIADLQLIKLTIEINQPLHHFHAVLTEADGQKQTHQVAGKGNKTELNQVGFIGNKSKMKLFKTNS